MHVAGTLHTHTTIFWSTEKSHQGMIADNNFFDDNIVRIMITNKFVHLYMYI